MDLTKIRALIDLLEVSPSVSELEFTSGDSTIRVSKFTSPAERAPARSLAAPPEAPAGALATPLVSRDEPVATPTIAPSTGVTIPSPMVGAVYLASSPTSPPLVVRGQRVKRGDPLCVIEAMKILNHVEAVCDGVVAEILVENGQGVEYGQPLFVLG